MAKVLSTTSRLYLGVFGLLMFPVLSAAIIGFVLIWWFLKCHWCPFLSTLGVTDFRRVALQWWLIPVHCLPFFHWSLCLDGSRMGILLSSWHATLDFCGLFSSSCSLFSCFCRVSDWPRKLFRWYATWDWWHLQLHACFSSWAQHFDASISLFRCCWCFWGQLV